MSRLGYVLVTLLAVELFVALFVGVAVLKPHRRFVWNASASVPVGLYRLHRADAVRVGDILAVAPPPAVARFLAARRYLPDGLPLMKPVAALPGQRVCRTGVVVTVDGRLLGVARARDQAGRALPVWRGCRTVAADELFLMNPAEPDSLDGRYFGVTPKRAVLGRAVPLLTRDAPGRPLVWRGFAA
ncbi:S26 family signal peptidase [Brevundimonas diminuta]|jgi:conjugative transfer signal peptidase TraF|uniref:S26 family signal peptidase n=1 Tax=Brevundimonas diminuta TaxID=293 RepID=UPI0019C010F1|nr:S26 family signal peptidase [Brevundimonas diminuta]MBD3817410.1 S26 family signal peptidase [Brevundimonas diminuta]